MEVRDRPDVEIFQNLWELDRMLDVFDRLQPERVLEVGCWHGGTLWYWLRTARKVVAVDDEMRLAEQWEQWAVEEGTELHLLRGMSQDPEIVEQARGLGPYNWLFLDADHRYQSVRADWEAYGPMVAPGGVIAFHDTLHPENAAEYGVGQLWDEITSEPDSRWMHIACRGHCGVGLLFVQ